MERATWGSLGYSKCLFRVFRLNNFHFHFQAQWNSELSSARQIWSSCPKNCREMSHLPRPTSAASTSSSSGIGTLSAGASKIPKPGFSASSQENPSNASTSSKNEDSFKVGDKVCWNSIFCLFTVYFLMKYFQLRH